MKIFLSAGEASGDLHGAELIKSLKKLDPETEFRFLGGDKMAAAADQQPLLHYRKMAFMGFTEVLRHLGTIFKNLSLAKKAISDFQPDAVVVIDYPGFNMKLARHARKLGIPVYYYIAPKVWAWKQWRVRTLKKDVTKILSILPFEPAWFARHGVQAIYVGNPSVEEILKGKTEFTKRENMLLLAPGSRVAEIRSNLPVMVQVAQRHPDLRPVIAAAPAIDPAIYSAITDIQVSHTPAWELMSQAQAALVTSGTAVLECSLAQTPQVACYRSNGLKIAYNLMKRVLHIPFVTLPNLIVNRSIVPEMLVHHCNPQEVDEALTALLKDSSAQLEGYQELLQRLKTTGSASENAAREIIG